jgi:hypothetical protein
MGTLIFSVESIKYLLYKIEPEAPEAAGLGNSN